MSDDKHRWMGPEHHAIFGVLRKNRGLIVGIASVAIVAAALLIVIPYLGRQQIELLEKRVPAGSGRTGVILSGGNVDLESLPPWTGTSAAFPGAWPRHSSSE